MSDNDLFVFSCPPLSGWPTPPHEHSKSKIINCPICDEPMWFSIKKEERIELLKKIKQEILLCCYTCTINESKKMKENGDIDENTKIGMIKI